MTIKCAIVFAAFLLAVNEVWLLTTNGIPQNITRCDQLPKQTLDFQSLVLNGPYFIYRTIETDQQCATGVATGLVRNKIINFIISRGTQIITNFHITLQNKKTEAYAVDCFSNTTHTFQFFVSRIKRNRGYIYWCPYVCSADGSSLELLRCYGRNSADEAVIQTYLDENVSKIPGYENVINSQANCASSENCQAFNV